MAQITGIVFIKVNGQLLRSKEGAKLNFGGKERTAVTGFEVYGYAEKVVPATVECTLAHDSDTNVEELRDIVGATLEFETDTGKTYLVKNAFVTKPPELTGGEGELSLEFSGEPAIEA